LLYHINLLVLINVLSETELMERSKLSINYLQLDEASDFSKYLQQRDINETTV